MKFLLYKIVSLSTQELEDNKDGGATAPGRTIRNGDDTQTAIHIRTSQASRQAIPFSTNTKPNGIYKTPNNIKGKILYLKLYMLYPQKIISYLSLILISIFFSYFLR